MLAGQCTQYSNSLSTSSRSRRLPPESKSNRRASSSSSIVLSFACPLQAVRNSPVNTTLKRNIFIILNLTLQQTQLMYHFIMMDCITCMQLAIVMHATPPYTSHAAPPYTSHTAPPYTSHTA